MYSVGMFVDYAAGRTKDLYHRITNSISHTPLGLESRLVADLSAGNISLDQYALFLNDISGSKPARIKRGFHLPGYNPEKHDLRRFIKFNYDVDRGSLMRALNLIQHGKMAGARQILGKKRKNLH